MLLRDGVSRVGHQGRLTQALARLRRGKGLVLAAIGASVTADHGGIVGEMQDKFSLTFFGGVRSCAGKCVRAGWLLPLLALLASDTFSPAGGPHAMLVNSGQSGTFLGRYLECTGTLVPEKADVILIDAATVSYSDLVGIEAVVRRLLALPHSPAVILLHFFDWCGCHQCNHRGCSECAPATRRAMHHNRSCYTAERLAAAGQKASAIEAPIDQIADHYGLPVLSVRRALLQPMLQPMLQPVLQPVPDAVLGTMRASDPGRRDLGRRDLGRPAFPGVQSLAGDLGRRDLGRRDLGRRDPAWFDLGARDPGGLTQDGLHPNSGCSVSGLSMGADHCTYLLLITSLVTQFFIDVKRNATGPAGGENLAPLPVPCSPRLLRRVTVPCDRRGVGGDHVTAAAWEAIM